MSDWKPIESIPEGQFVDVWIGHKKDSHYGKRVTNVCKTQKHSRGWVGIEDYYLTDEVHPTHWMPLPEPPKQ